ncbi:MAG: hypothetical protein RIF32_10430 [Leptospirales bacterium]|jgi:hypothetical protein
MKRIFQIIAILATGLAFTVACNDGHSDGDHHNGEMSEHHGEGHHNDDGHHMQNITKVVKAAGVQAAFDVMTAANHMKMSETMGSHHKQKAGTDHHLSVTLMDLENKKVIKDAKIKAITVTGPDGKSTSDAGDMMTGNGMFHHGLDFKMSGTGTYRAKVEFTWDGKTFEHAAEFKM